MVAPPTGTASGSYRSKPVVVPPTGTALGSYWSKPRGLRREVGMVLWVGVVGGEAVCDELDLPPQRYWTALMLPGVSIACCVRRA